jgi:hypothetical protein
MNRRGMEESKVRDGGFRRALVSHGGFVKKKRDPLLGLGVIFGGSPLNLKVAVRFANQPRAAEASNDFPFGPVQPRPDVT